MKKNNNAIALAMMSGTKSSFRGVDINVFAADNAERIFYGDEEYRRSNETHYDMVWGYSNENRPDNVSEAARLLATIWPNANWRDDSLGEWDVFGFDAYNMLGIDFINEKTENIGTEYYTVVPVNMNAKVPAQFEGFSAQERVAIFRLATKTAWRCGHIVKAIPVKY